MRTVTFMVFSLFLAFSSANAAPVWTSTGNAGTIDPSQIANATIGNSSVGYAASSTSTAPISVRYNVNVDSTTSPAWSNIEILGNDGGVASAVFATLYGVNRSNGTVTLIGSVSSTGFAGTQAYSFGLGTSVTFDFNNNYYVIKATISRSSTSSFPTLQGVRLY